MAGWPTNGTPATVAVGAVTDAGYTLTFSGGGLQGSDVAPFSVTDGTGGASGTVTETTKGAKGLLPTGAVATVGTVADTGYTVTFGGSLTKTDALPLSVTDGTGGTTGTVRENARGSNGVAGWLSDTTVTIGAVADTGYNVTFNALTPLGSARQTGLGDVTQLVVANGTGGTAGTVSTTTQGKSGIGQGACTNSGDGHIRYDQLAHRWLFTIPAFTRVGGLYAMCQAVSVGEDPLGPYNRYVFRRSLFPDYPRVAIWTDGYYNATSTGDNVIEKHACATDRTKMIAGLDATEQCIIVPAVSFMEPASIEGQALPPAGAPEHFFAAGGYQLRSIFEDDGIYAYKFHVDWANPMNSTFTGPQKITVAPYHFLCNGQLTQCVPQPNSTTRLDSQGDKIMHGIVYRNVNGVESMVMLHSIATEVGAGAEGWFEMRLDANRDPYLYQQSTYAPDDHYRWLGSPNIDRKGDIALAYSFGGGPYILPIATTMSAASVVGATNIKVAAVTGTNVNFAVGGKINIGTGATLETATVAAVGTAGAAGTGIDLTAPLTIAHASASTVSNAAFVCTPPACLPVGQRYTARQPGDPLNQMTYQEGVIIEGIGAAGGSRWEDWSKLAVDPTDDCTFWYFGGYGEPGRAGGPYFARTGAFRIPTCRLDAAGAAASAIPVRYTGPVAMFTDSDLTAGAGDFSASIDWGDGSTSDGTVTGGAGSFTVSGTHTYATTGPRTITTSITGTDGSIASAVSEVIVYDFPAAAARSSSATGASRGRSRSGARSGGGRTSSRRASTRRRSRASRCGRRRPHAERRGRPTPTSSSCRRRRCPSTWRSSWPTRWRRRARRSRARRPISRSCTSLRATPPIRARPTRARSSRRSADRPSPRLAPHGRGRAPTRPLRSRPKRTLRSAGPCASSLPAARWPTAAACPPTCRSPLGSSC